MLPEGWPPLANHMATKAACAISDTPSADLSRERAIVHLWIC